jgi:hypothetical protein
MSIAMLFIGETVLIFVFLVDVSLSVFHLLIVLPLFIRLLTVSFLYCLLLLFFRFRRHHQTHSQRNIVVEIQTIIITVIVTPREELYTV